VTPGGPGARRTFPLLRMGRLCGTRCARHHHVDRRTREGAVIGAFLQVTFHELGHGMFDIYDIPVLDARRMPRPDGGLHPVAIRKGVAKGRCLARHICAEAPGEPRLRSVTLLG